MSDDPNLRDDVDDIDDEDDGYDDGPDPNSVLVATAVAVLDYVVRSVVSQPDDVTVDVEEDRSPIRLDVRVADGDMGRVVGKRGRTAQAIRTVVRAAAHRDGAEVDIEFVD